MQVFSVEGNQQKLDGGSMFGNVPRGLWQQWISPDEQHRIRLACRGLLVTDLDGKCVLFETGIGTFLEPKLRGRYGVFEAEHRLLQSLEDRGVPHDMVDAVVLSHLHFDHAGGLLAPFEEGQPLRLLFPNARFIVGEAAFGRAVNPHPRDRASFIPGLTDLLRNSRRLEIVRGEHSATLGEAVRFLYSEGHTPGLMLAEIGGRGGVVFCGDLIPGRPWVHLPVTMGFDRNPEMLIDEKRVFLDRALERNLRLFFTHDPECALARVVNTNGRYSTVEEQASVDGLRL